MTKSLVGRLITITVGLTMLVGLGAVFISTPTETVDAQAACGLLWDAKYYNDRELGADDGQLIWVECLAPLTNGGLSTTFDNAALPDNNFSASIERSVDFNGGTHRFTATFEDGIRLYVGTELVIDEWTSYPGPRTISGDVFIEGLPQSVKVEFFNANGGNARLSLGWTQLTSATATPSGGGGGGGGSSATATPTCDDSVSTVAPWLASYFDSTDWSGLTYLVEVFGTGEPLSRDYSTGSPGGLLDVDNWSVIFAREVEFPITSTVTFTMTVDDTATIYLDGEALVASHPYYSGETYTAVVEVAEGIHTVEVYMAEYILEAFVNVTWTNAENGGGGSCSTTSSGSGDVNSPTGVVATVTASVGLNYRDCPSLSCTKLGKIDFDTSWAVLGRTSDSVWANLDVGGVSVWALSEWLSFSGGDFNTVPVTWDDGLDDELPDGIPIRAVGNVKLRECPGFNCARITYVPWGTQVVVTGKSSNGYWLKIAYNDPELGVVYGWSYALWYYNDDLTLPLPELPIIAD